MYSGAGQQLMNVLGKLSQPARQGVARRVLPQLLPMTEMSGSPALQTAGRRAAVNAGLVGELDAFPSVISRQGDNLGLLGIGRSASAPTPTGLNPSLRGFTGAPNVEVLSPEMRAIVRAAEQSRPSPSSAPGVRGVPSLAQNRPPVPLQEPPTPPVRYPGARPAGETRRQITFLKPGEDEVGSMGSRLTYRPGTQGTKGRLGSTTYGEGIEAGVDPASYRRSKDPSAAELVEQRLAEGFPVREAPGTPLLRTDGSNQYVAPVPQFGGSRGGALGGAAVEDLYGKGGALVRSPGGGLTEDLMIDPVFVQEISRRNPALAAGLRNATAGAALTDLASVFDPRVIAALSAAGVGGAGLAALFGGGEDKVGEPSAGTPPEIELPQALTRPMFTESDGTPLGDGAPAVAPPNPPARGNIDPSAPVIYSGADQRDSAVREQMAQNSPGAAAVQRALEPKSPEQYRSIEEYYAARKAYAEGADKRQELMRFMEGQSESLSSELGQWAQANPALAYEIQRRQLKNDAANQQSNEARTTNIATTQLGSDTPANAVGAGEAARQAVLNPTQGSLDMADALRMQNQPHLQRVQSMIQNMAPRSRMYAGY